MATDPATLLAQANCYACFGNGGTWAILELALIAQWGAQAANLIPAGATYDSGGTYLFAVTPGQQYFVTLVTAPNGNDGILDTNPGTIVGPCTHTGFTATLSPIAFHGVVNALVTATLTTS